MRIVAGRWRGRRLDVPPGRGVRPTLDRVREAWMSILQAHLPGARVLDLYAGSGALGLESLSRGAVSAVFVEKDPRTIEVLAKNIEVLGAEESSVVRRTDALRFAESLAPRTYDVAFADPPYAGGAAERIVEVWLDRPFASILSVEHDARVELAGGYDSRRYGSSAVTFYRSED